MTRPQLPQTEPTPIDWPMLLRTAKALGIRVWRFRHGEPTVVADLADVERTTR
jgi:hypothetical protein